MEQKPENIAQQPGTHNTEAGFCRECSGGNKPCGNADGKSPFGKLFSSKLFADKPRKQWFTPASRK